MHPLQLSLLVNKETLSIGEDVELTIQWKNIGDKPFHVFKRIIYSTDLVKASDIHGEELEHFLNVLMELRPLTIDDYKLLKPGEMYVKKLMVKLQISETRPKEHVLNFGNSEYRLGNNKKILKSVYDPRRKATIRTRNDEGATRSVF